MKRILFTALFIGLLFIYSPFAYAGDVSYQIDVGSFDIWKNSAGEWIPSDPPNYSKAYKPNDKVEILPYAIPAPAGVTGVKSVKFAPYEESWQLGGRVNEFDKYSPFFTTNLTDIDYTFNNNTLEVSYKIVLKTPERVDEETGETLTTGKSEKKEWQSQTVEGYRYYLPLLIEWEKGSPPDFYPTPEGETEWKEEFITSPKTYIGEVGETLNIPVNLYNQGEEDITDFGCTWYGAGWDNIVWLEEDIRLSKGEKRSFTIPVTVPTHGEETRLVFRANIDGLTPASEVNQDNNIMIIIVRPEGEIDLALYTDKAVIEGPKNTTTSITVMVHNLSEVPVITKAGWIYFDNIEAGWTNVTLGDIELEAGERKDFLLPVTVTDKARTMQIMVNYNRDYPMAEVDYSNNAVDILVRPISAGIVPPSGGQELNYQAWRQWSYLDVMGHPREYREKNTAKYTDIVETTLTPTKVKRVVTTVNKGDYIDYTNTIAPPAPTCGDSCGAWNTMTDWRITKATLHYPTKSPDFTFYEPVWDHLSDWGTMGMTPQGKSAITKFKEEWAMDGFPIHNVKTGYMKLEFPSPDPKHYTLRADYEIQVTYDQTCGRLVCGKTSCWCEYDTTRGLTATYRYTGTGKLLINGTGVGPVPTQSVVEFKEMYPHLVEVPY